MKIQIVCSRFHAFKLKPLLVHAGLSLGIKPDAVIAYGGDGTLLEAEQRYPGIPKLLIRFSPTCQKCRDEPAALMFAKLRKGELPAREFAKIEACTGSKRLTALNDVVIHTSIPTKALRFRVFLGKTLYADGVIGDGIVVATPFGSGGYYRSITDSTFAVGMGLAFNNTTRQVDHTVVDERTVVAVEILRGPALLGVDNVGRLVKVPAGAAVVVKKAKEKAYVFDHPMLLCDECRRAADRKTRQSE